MPRGQTKPDVQRNGRQSSVLKSLANEGKRPCGIKRKQLLKPVRKSTRLQEIQRKTTERKHLFPSPSASNSFVEEIPQDLSALENPPNLDRKRKRSQEAEYPTPRDQEKPVQKRIRTSLESNTAEDKEVVSDIDNKKSNSINHWIQEGSWPKKYFEQEINMTLPLAQKKSSASLRRQALEATTGTPTQVTEDKSAVYKDPSYTQFLKEQGSFLDEFHQGIEENSKNECQNLLNTEQTVPKDYDTLFRDDVFQSTCAKLRDRNEARVINDIARLIVPSAETLATCGATDLEILIVGMNERWNESIPLTPSGTHPQPDFCVGFQRSAFTREQLKKLEPFTGNIFARIKLSSFLLATWRINFPFLTCEVKCGLGGLDIADRQNANSMTLSVRGLVELFRFVKREKEIHKKILAFSISHDDKAARIYGHYPIIDGDKTSFYRHSIKNFDFTSEEGKEKWTTYKFTKNVYDTFMPKHHKLICSAIDDIPVDLNFGVSLGDSFASVASADESDLPNSQEIATSAPTSQDTAGFKKPRLTANAMLKEQNDGLKEQLAQQKQENKENKQEMKELKEQIKELMNMLKQRTT